jgi:hypothetical protein
VEQQNLSVKFTLISSVPVNQAKGYQDSLISVKFTLTIVILSKIYCF